MSGRVIPFHQRFDRLFTGFATSKDRSDRPEKPSARAALGVHVRSTELSPIRSG